MSLLRRLFRRGAFPEHLRDVKPQDGRVSDAPSSLPHPCDCHRDYHVLGCPRRPTETRHAKPSAFRIPMDIPGFDSATMSINGEPVVVYLASVSGLMVERPDMSTDLTPQDIANGRCR